MNKERKCKFCGEQIPHRIKIEGKFYSLQNRKTCLSCLPFKTKLKTSKKPREYTRKYKDQVILSLYKRGLDRKQLLLEKSGGKCSICGYSKSKRALGFHHKDPDTKLFGLSLNILWSKPMEDIWKEHEKCILVCSNCHFEIEEEKSREKYGYVEKVNEKYGTDF